MGQLRNSRWESFAISLSLGKRLKDAHLDAGYSPGSVGASSSLAKRPEIMERVAELLAERHGQRKNAVHSGEFEHLAALDNIAAGDEVTSEWIVVQLLENARLAREMGQFSASNQALRFVRDITIEEERRRPADVKARDGVARLDVDVINKLLVEAGLVAPVLTIETSDAG